ncbi:MAG: hypothetical protein H6923_06955 [Alphaproteobacteria bacterium]|nr:hypothetical protein [Alphaproteobacteria bacterium]
MRAAASGLLLVLLAACASLERGPPACEPDFPLTDRWLGGDGVFSAPLRDGRTLWLFDDSFVTHKAGEGRRDAALVANSVGVSECGREGFSIAYRWRGGEAPRAVFETGEEGTRYWPQVALGVDEAIFVLLLKVRVTEPGDPLGFEAVGVDLARIEGAEGPIEDWQISIVPAATGGEVLPALLSSIHFSVDPDGEAHGGFLGLALHAAGPGTRRALPMLLSTPLDAASEPLKNLIHALGVGPLELALLGPDGKFHAGQDAAKARALFSDAAPELSLVRRVDARSSVLVSMDGGFPSDTIVARTELPSPVRPSDTVWSDPVTLHRVPERDPASPEYRKNAFCYAGKAHGAFRKDGKVAVTYVCNAFEPEDLFGDLTLYRPRVVYLKLPEIP